MIRFEQALRESAAYQSIKRDVDGGNLAHAYMIISPDGEAVKELLLLIGCTVYCKRGACMECADCNKVQHYNHSDVTYVNQLEKAIGVSDVNEMINDSYILPNDGERKLYFILAAEKMNAAAQNKFLKTLEEPPQSVTLFLAVKNENMMLETIKSRVRKVYLDVFSREQVYREVLSATGNVGKARVASACSEGMLGRAMEIAESESYAALYDRAYELLGKLGRSTDVAALMRWDVFSKENISAFLDILTIVFRDMLVIKNNKELVLSQHKAEETAALAESYSSVALAKIVYLINEERKRLYFSVNAQSVAENLLLGILEVRHKWQ